MSEITVIELTEDTEVLAKLRRKLEEYDTRLLNRSPEADPHATYKRDILKYLLETGGVITDELMSKAKTLVWFNEWAFKDALAIVNAYNSDNTGLLYGGTGLS